jgi:hypothetical protein
LLSRQPGLVRADCTAEHHGDAAEKSDDCSM